jgi:hypothetical protein
MTACCPCVFQGEELPAYQPRQRGDRAMDVVVVGGTLAGLVAEVLLLAALLVAVVERHDS